MPQPKTAAELSAYIDSELPTNDVRQITAENVRNCLKESANAMMSHEQHIQDVLGTPTSDDYEIPLATLQNLFKGKITLAFTIWYDPNGATDIRASLRYNDAVTPIRNSAPSDGRFVNAAGYIDHDPATVTGMALRLSGSGTPLIRAIDIQMVRMAGT